MRARSRWLMSALGVAALTVPILSGAAAGASDTGPNRASVDILGGDTFVHPGLFTNNYHFPEDPTVIAQGGTITFHNMTKEAHTISLVTDGALPKNTSQVDNCVVCGPINNAFGLTGNGHPTTAQLDNGMATDDASQADADTPDPGAKAGTGPFKGTVLIEDFDTPSSVTKVGDATIINTPNVSNNGGFLMQRAIVVTAKPGLYHYICTLHPWMQGEIRVVG
jgi:plastocyanin